MTRRRPLTQLDPLWYRARNPWASVPLSDDMASMKLGLSDANFASAEKREASKGVWAEEKDEAIVATLARCEKSSGRPMRGRRIGSATIHGGGNGMLLFVARREEDCFATWLDAVSQHPHSAGRAVQGGPRCVDMEQRKRHDLRSEHLRHLRPRRAPLATMRPAGAIVGVRPALHVGQPSEPATRGRGPDLLPLSLPRVRRTLQVVDQELL